MKSLLLLILLTSPALAWEKRLNPDRFPSIGLELGKGQEPGIPRAGINGNQTNAGTFDFIGDFKFPVTDAFTMHASFQNIGINNNLSYTEGYRIAVGARIYLQD